MDAINWFYLAGSWVLNFFDLLMLYLVVNSLVDQRLKLTFKKCGFALIYAVGMGALVHFVGGFVYHAVFLIMMLYVIRLITKRVVDVRNIADDILLLVIAYLIVFTLNTITSFLVVLTALPEMWSMLVAYPVSIMIFSLLRRKVDFNRLFLLIIDRILLKLLFFILFSMFILTFAIISFDSFALLEYIILFFVLGITSAIGLIYTIKIAYLYTDTLPERYHDVDELLSILKNKAQQATSVEQLQRQIDEIIGLIGIKVSESKQQSASSSQAEATILATIESLKLNATHRAEIVTNIRYQAAHETINDVLIAYILGIPLKNAMQTLTKRPIFVDIFSAKSLVKITVANETSEKTEKELKRLLQKGYSTKGKVGRGYGLAKLKKLVEKYDGEINISQEYHLDEGVNYIKFVVIL